MKKLLTFLFILSIVSIMNAYASVIYVNQAASGNNDGTSWNNAFTTLQAALDAAASGDQIWVKAGTYKPSYDYGLGIGNRGMHFRMKKVVAIYGGFAGNEDPATFNLAERNFTTNETILSGDIGTENDSTDNCYHVFYHPAGNGLANSAILDGFTITGGNANGSSPHNYGGGIYNYSSLPTIRNCSFKNNSANNGAAMYNNQSSAPIITNCSFLNNCAFESAGAMYNYFSEPSIKNCIFSGNSAVNNGGAFLNNSSVLVIVNSTIYNNNGGTAGGAMYNTSSFVSLNNSIIWGNTSTNAGKQIAIVSGTTVLNYSCYSNGENDISNSGTFTATNNNITTNPKFVDAANGDFRLYGISPCVDAGYDDYNALTTDIRGVGFGRKLDKNNQALPGYIDMGAYEYKKGTDPLSPPIYVKHNAEGANDGTSWTNAFTTLQAAIDLATEGAQIWVAAGTYYPSNMVGGTTDRHKTFQMKNGVAIYGGFDGTEDPLTFDLASRNFISNETILSGDLSGDDIITGSGQTLSISNNSENCYHIVYIRSGLNLTNSAVLDGFTISKGNANETSGDNSFGGGILIKSSSPLIKNITIYGNKGSYGGGFYSSGSTPKVQNSIITNNISVRRGAGVEFSGGSTSSFTNVLITNNKSIAPNTFGGGISIMGASPVFNNVTIANNYAASRGGGLGIDAPASSPVLNNCIVWGNTAAGFNDVYGHQVAIFNGSLALNYCCYSNGTNDVSNNGTFTATNNNITSYPDFVDATNGDFRLIGPSPCADAGNDAYNDLITDIRGAGVERKLNKTTGLTGTIDMGAYEYKKGVDPWGTYFVTVDGAGSKDGTSWDNAFEGLQAALDVAAPGDSIWVAAGTYIPTSTYDMKDTACNYHFRMKNGVAIYGGFAGTENPATFNLADRDFENNETILSGDLLGNDVFDINQHGFIDTTGNENSYHVFYHPDSLALDSTAILDGFTIKGGNAVGYYEISFGGGIYNISSSPKLTNLILMNNFADDDGGGICNKDNSEPIITNLTITYNSAYNGGGMFNENSSPIITNSVISYNLADNGAGIANNENSSPTITNSIISYNNAEYMGGGIMNEDNSSPILTDVKITYNSSMYNGGGIVNEDNSSPVLTNVTISNNSSLLYGGGITNIVASSPIITNAIISNNSSMYGGGICNMENSTPTITNSTISNNTGMYGGGISNMLSSPTVNNSIIWGNTGVLSGNQIYSVSGGSITLNYSCYSNEINDNFGIITANNCITTNPEFVDAANDDYRIAGSSPCVNSGNNAYVLAPNPVIAEDYRGEARIQNTTIDMGAFEWTAGVDPICKNPTNGGTIAAAQTICYNTTPAEITNSTAPTGFSGTLEYKWQQSTTSSSADFTDIESSNSEDYSPAALTQTTWYKRLARVNCQNDWTSAVESNVLQITVRPQFTAGAIATEGEVICNNTGSFAQITSSTAASGGDGTITYKWQANGVDIPTSNSATYTPPTTLAATTTYTRFAKDGTCNTEFTQSTGSWTVTINPVVSAALSGNATICKNTLANLYVTLTGTAPWSVTFSDGVTIVNILNSNYARAVSPNSTTLYTITDVTDANGCSAVGTDSATITIRPTSTAVLSGSGNICAGETAILTVNLTGIAPYYIDFSDGFSILWYFGNTYQRQVSPNTTTNYTITVTDGCNLAADVSGAADVTVNAKPTAYNVSGGGLYCSGGDGVEIGLDDSESGVNYQLLRNGNNVGSPVAGTGSSISFGNKTLAGTYTVEATNTTTSCENTMTGSATVSINSKPTAVLSGTTTICSGTSALLTVHLTGDGPWSLIFSDNPIAFIGITSSPFVREVSPTETTVYTVTSVSDGNCSNTGTGSATITVNEKPTATISGSAEICNGSSTDLSIALTGTAPWTILYSDGVSESGITTTLHTREVTPNQTTNYTITNVIDANCSNSGTGSATVTINAKPTAVLSGTTHICAGSSTELKVALTGEAPWSLTFSDSSTPIVTSDNPYVRIVNPATTTAYTIEEVTDNNGCSNVGTGTATITVNPLPTATISGTTSICSGEIAQLTVVLTGMSPFLITFSDGSYSFVSGYIYKRTVKPTEHETHYSVTSVVDAYGCSNAGTGTATITLNQLPTAHITGDAEICMGGSTDIAVALTGQAPWTIVFSDRTSVNTSTNPYIRTVSPNQSCAYGVTSVTDGNGCENTGTGLAVIEVNPKPTATIFGTTAICDGGSAILTVELTGEAPWSLTFSDDPTNPITGIETSPYQREVSPTVATNYTLLNVTDGNSCSNYGLGIAQIIVRPLPTATISGDATICNGESTDLTVTMTGIAPFGLTFSDGYQVVSYLTTYIREVSPNQTMNYKITEVTDGYFCSNVGTDSALVTVYPQPSAVISGTTEICYGADADLTVNLIGKAPWSVTFSDDVTIDNIQTTPYTRTIENITEDITYTITDVTDACGFSAIGTGEAEIAVGNLPTAEISGTTAICNGESTDLTVEMTGPSPWSLTFSDDFVINNLTTSPYVRSVSPTETTTYTVSITDNCANTVSGTGEAEITVHPLPTASISGTTEICSGETADLTVILTGEAPWSVTFSDNYTENNILTSPYIREVSPNTTFDYTILNVTDGNGCENVGNGNAEITINPLPTATLSGDSTICNGTSADLSVDLTGSAPFTIEFADGFIANNVNTLSYQRTVSPTETTEYSIVSVIDFNGCENTSTGTATITVRPLPEAVLSGDASICYGANTDLTVDLIGTAPFTIEFEDGFIAENVNTNPYIRNVNPLTTTVYTLANVTDACGLSTTGTGSATIEVGDLPTATISGSTSICNGQEADLTVVLTGAAPWSITFSDNVTIDDIQTSPYIREVSPLITTEYTITDVTDGCNNSVAGTGAATITVNPLPTAEISGDATICLGESTALNVVMTGNGPFTLEFSDGFVAEDINSFTYQRNVSPSETTIYTITAIIDGCNTNIAGTGSANVTVHPLPTATLSGEDAICVGSSAVLTVDLTGTAPWTITFSDSFIAENVLTSPYLREVTPTEDVAYTINNVTDGNGCSNIGTGSTAITVNPLPTASLSGEQTICYGTTAYLSIQLTGTPPFFIVFEDGWSVARINSYTYNRKVKPLVNTVYAIAYITDANGCTNTSDGEATVNVNPLPLVFNVVGDESVVGLDGSELGITYFLQLNGVQTGLSLPGTGASISFGEQTVAGTYKVLAVNDLTDCSKLMNSSYIIGGRESAASQVIDMQSGWNLISSYVEPRNQEIDDIFGGIANQINIVKTGDGLMYVPVWDLNTIRNWNPSLGYAINATSATQLVMQGENIEPEYYPIQLNDGWNLISYLRDNQTSPEFALSSIEGEYTLVKNNDGGVFAPAWGLNTIGYMKPGKGYYIYTNDNAVLTYPSNSAMRAVAGEHFTPLAKHTSPQFSKTGNNATLLINLDGDNNENEIAVFNQNNEILGTAAIENGVAVVTIWGDDEITNEVDGAVFNEPLIVKLFNSNILEYQELSLTRIKEITGDTELDELKYRTNAIYSARVSAQNNANNVLSITNVPNPASSYTTFEFNIANDGDAEILIYSMKGDLVAKLGNKEYKTRTHKLNFEIGEIASGVYNVILWNGTDRATTLMIIQK